MAVDPKDESIDLMYRLARLGGGEAPRVIELFSGCGGMSLGLLRAGYHLLGAVEINPKAISTYASNFFKGSDAETRQRHAEPHDITKFPPDRFMREVLHAESPEHLIDVVVGGPPCQAFSRIGRAKLRSLRNNPEAFLEDDRSNLYLSYLSYVEFFRPLAVLIENVPDIMQYGKRNVAEEIVSVLDELGYRCQYTILNAAHYGVPQLRQRFFLIALRKELDTLPNFPEPTHFAEPPSGYEVTYHIARNAAQTTPTLFSQRAACYVAPPESASLLPYAVTTQEALDDLPPITAHLHGQMRRGVKHFTTLAPYRSGVTLSNYTQMMRGWPGFASLEGVWDHVIRYLPRDYETFARMQHDDQYPQAHAIAKDRFEEEIRKYVAQTGEVLTEESDYYKKSWKSIVPPYDVHKFPNKWWKLNPNQPSRTLTAHMGKDTYSHIHYDSEQKRVISVREAARLQSFPDGFQFTGPMDAAFTQIGNAVSPLQSYALGRHIRTLLQQAAQKIPIAVAL